MRSQPFTSTFDIWTHGWHGFPILYLLVAAFSFAGLKRGRASPRHYLFWPFTTLLTLVAVALLSELVTLVLAKASGIHLSDPYHALAVLGCIMVGGFAGGLYWAARGRPLEPRLSRGAVVGIMRI
jgi:hypothetical protein